MKSLSEIIQIINSKDKNLIHQIDNSDLFYSITVDSIKNNFKFNKNILELDLDGINLLSDINKIFLLNLISALSAKIKIEDIKLITQFINLYSSLLEKLIELIKNYSKEIIIEFSLINDLNINSFFVDSKKLFEDLTTFFDENIVIDFGLFYKENISKFKLSIGHNFELSISKILMLTNEFVQSTILKLNKIDYFNISNFNTNYISLNLNYIYEYENE